MKKKYLFQRLITVIALSILFAGCGGSSSSGGGGGGDTNDPASQTFTSGSSSLTASTTTSGSTKTTTVADSSGTTIVTVALTTTGVSLTFPGQSTTADTTFSEALPTEPTNFAAQALAVYIAGQVSGITAACVIKDSPGCDWFPDTQCTLGCCADHDYCYDLNGCGASSWLLVGASAECINCNGIAEYCISRACAGVDSSRTDDRCYDNRCHQFYDCGVADCYTCTSPCDSVSPTACTSSSYTGCCGNGTCEVQETTTNCPGDCVDGDGYNQCCYSSSDCPSELAYSCPGSCCCCGLGEVCAQDGSHLCTTSSRGMSLLPKGSDIMEIMERCEDRPKSECQ